MEAVRILLYAYIIATWRHRWVALAAAWVICGLGWFAVSRIPDQFEASTRLYVDADAILTPLLRGLAVDDPRAGQVDLLQRTLLSGPNLEKLISRTDLNLTVNSVAERDRLIARLARDIHIQSQTSNLFTITYRSTSPRLALQVVQTMLALFQDNAAQANQSDMNNAKQFLNRQIANYEQQLREAERRRADFRAKYLDLLPADGGGISGLEAARSAVTTLQDKLQDENLLHTALQKELASTQPLVVVEDAASNPVATTRQQLVDAERTLAELRLRYTDQHPDVIAQRNIVAALKSGAIATPDPAPAPAARPRSAPNPIYEALKLRLVDSEATIAQLQRQIDSATRARDQLETMARAVPEVQAQYQGLDRDYSVLRHDYEELLSRREAANLAEAADTQADKVKLEVVDPPQLPRLAVAPNRLLLMTGVLMAGLGGGAGLAFLLGQLSRSYNSVEDLRALGLPVLGGISLLQAPRPYRGSIAVLGFGAAVLLLVMVYGGLLGRMLHLARFT
jgi:polysaccharide chain length determinant protein (PEP-CTERM system associated)